MFGYKSEDSTYFPSKTHTEDDGYDGEDDFEAEEGYDVEFDYYDADVDGENSGDELEDVAENDANVPVDDGIMFLLRMLMLLWQKIMLM
jgi:hypothetical protein